MRSSQIVIALFLVLLYTGITTGETIYVTWPGPIQSAIASAQPGDIVLVGNGIYKGPGNVNLDFQGKAITVRSENGAENCVIDCENVDGTRAFYFHSGETLDSVVDGFKIQNGRAPGGGGVYCYNFSSPTIKNNIIIGNTSIDGSPGGGGIGCNHYCDPLITNNIITNNKAIGGSLGLLEIGGGGISCYDHCSASITGNTVTGNQAVFGAGISCYISSIESPLTIADNTISGNSVFSNPFSKGGGIYCHTSSVLIDGNHIEDNTGSGIYCYNDSAAVPAGFPEITSNTIVGNKATVGLMEADNAGGIAIIGFFCNPTISNNIITENSAFYGGGIYCKGARSRIDYPAITNNVIAKNWASYLSGSYGGGICSNNSYVMITNNTITENQADYGGAIFCSNGSSLRIDNTILWKDSPNEIHLYSSGSPNTVTISHSDIEGGRDGIVNGTVYWLEGNINEDPLFVDPDNGNYHLGAPPVTPSYSPCIGAGTMDISPFPSPPPTDIEGNARPYPPGCNPDMGAYESSFSLPDIQVFPESLYFTKFKEIAAIVDDSPQGVNFDPGAPIISNEIIVKFRSGALKENPTMVNGTVQTLNASINALFMQLEVQDMKRVFSTTRSPLGEIYHLRFAASISLSEALTLMANDPNVDWVEPNYLCSISVMPNDYNPSQQWGLAKIQADLAWDYSKGHPGIVIAVIDTGVDYDHPDLEGNIWHNPGEIPGNDVDDDKNGYVDDDIGWDFVSYQFVAPGEDPGPRDRDPMDFHGHGTHCSGIASAVTDNGVGVAGTAWNCRIMAVRAGYKTVDGRGRLQTTDCAAALQYVADNDADMVSMSWSSSYDSNILRLAIQYAESRGCILIAAAGNSSTDQEGYPAAYPGVIAVAASDENDNRAWFSNYGSWVDIAAPGVNIYSTMYNNTYHSWSGTSMATPFVAGVAGLILSQDPTLKPDAVRQRLIDSADDINWDRDPAIKRLNAYRTVEKDTFTVYSSPGPVGGPLNVTDITPKYGSLWLETDLTAFTVPCGGSQEVSVSIDTTDLVVDTYNDQLLIYSDDPDENPYPNGVYVTLELKNTVPQIVSLTADSNPVGEYSNSEMNVVTQDADHHALSYNWSATGGSITGSGSSATYQAPDVSERTIYTVGVTVDDGYGGSDTTSIEVVVSPKISIKAFSPVDLIVTDTEGRVVSKDRNDVPYATYTEEDADEVVILDPPLGSCSIQVIPEPGAEPTDTYTLHVEYDGETDVLADNVQIQDIPPEPYIFNVSTISIELTQPSADITVTQGNKVIISWTGRGPEGSYVELWRDNDDVWDNGGHVAIANGQPVSGNYEWDTTGSPPGVYYIVGRIVSDTESAYDYALGRIEIKSATSVIDLQLSAGWNMLSCPGDPVVSDIPALVAGTPVLPFAYTWDPVTGTCILMDNIAFGVGYWFASTEDCVLDMSYLPHRTLTRPINGGWNMTGSIDCVCPVGSITSDPPDSILTNSIYTWNTDIQNYEIVTDIVPGGGYWTAAIADCVMSMSCVTSPMAQNRELMDSASPIWRSMVAVKSQDQQQKLLFGMHPSASDAFDKLLDKPLPPPPVAPSDEVKKRGGKEMSGILKAAWLIPDTTFPMLRESYVKEGTQGKWELSVELSRPGKIEWSDLPEGYSCVLHYDKRSIDMNAKKFLPLPPGEYNLTLVLDASDSLPEKTQLLSNYPNPFNPETWIPYELKEDNDVAIRIYTATGQLVRTLSLGHKRAGFYATKAKAAYWDGKSEAGEHVASGVYFYTIQAGDFTATKKMVVAR